jgi:CBS domain-containing protein
MTQPAVTAREDATLEEVARVMLARRIGGVPVVDARGRLRGIITEADFAGREEQYPFSTFRWLEVFGRSPEAEGIEAIYRQARARHASEIMTADVVTVSENDPVEQVLIQMVEHGVHLLPIVRDGVPVGIVARHDLLRLMLRTLRANGMGPTDQVGATPFEGGRRQAPARSRE